MKELFRLLCLWLFLLAILVESSEERVQQPTPRRAIVHIPAIRSAGFWSGQYDFHVPIIYYGNSRQIKGFSFRLATDTSRLLVKSLQSNVFRKNTDSVVIEYSLSPISVAKLRGFNSTVYIRTAPGHETSEDESGDNIQLSDGDTLVTFTLSKKVLRDFKRSFIPISWIWLDCDDNQLITPENHSLSSSVIDYQYNDCIYDLREPDITDTTQSLPTTRGAPAECAAPSPSPFTQIRELVFKNGGVYPYTPGVRTVGDANTNSIPYEIDDALEVARFITQGSPWQSKKYRHMGNPDMNCDNYVGDISDFALLMRAATGDIMREFYVADSITPDTITFSQDRDVLSLDRPVIAALLIFDNEFQVEVTTDGLRSDTGTIDGNTHVLIYNLGQDNDSLLSVPPGELLKTWGVLIDAYAVNYDGYKLHTVITY